jgi:hypothetical protein
LHELVEDGLRDLADPEVQSRLWLASDGSEASSLTECRETLWSDSGLADALEGGGIVYTAQIDEQLRRLRGTLTQIDDLRPPRDVLSDPSLLVARELASNLLLSIRAVGYDGDDSAER